MARLRIIGNPECALGGRTLGLSTIDVGPDRMPTHFPRSARLLNAADYSAVFGKNTRYSDRYWTILVHKTEHPVARLGMAIAKKRAKRAVDRNRLKRVVREAFRHHCKNLAGTELVIMNRDAAVNADNRLLSESLSRLFAKVSGNSGG